MKKILLLLFSLSLLDVYAQNDDYPTDIPSTYTNPGVNIELLSQRIC